MCLISGSHILLGHYGLAREHESKNAMSILSVCNGRYRTLGSARVTRNLKLHYNNHVRVEGNLILAILNVKLN